MKRLFLIGLGLMLFMAPKAAEASYTLNFDPTNTFSGTAPAGSLTATFTDVTGGVQLTVTSSLATGENLDPGKALYFNFNPSKDSSLGDLSFALTGNTGFSQQSTVETGADSFKADGDGYYDIEFTYTPSTKAFTTGESQTYLIKDSGGSITASDFTQYLSSTGGGTGDWYAAVHVQNTPSGGSGSAWVGAESAEVGVSPTPIPAAAWLFGSGLAGLIGIKRKYLG
ncbi:MAG: VPLPA-CTERM sorting domain-containing protein [Syntrophobacteraceae bacterium]